MPMCYNFGRTDVCKNGFYVQLSAMLDSHDPTWDRGKLTFADDNRQIDVGMLYSNLSPKESRRLAKELLNLADELEEQYNNHPAWAMLYNNVLAFNEESVVVLFDSEEKVKIAVENYRKEENDNHYGYRRMTIDEFYRYMDH